MTSWPIFEQDEIDAVVNVLKSGKVNYWTGSEVKNFEQEFADYLQVPHVIALANGTLALELALKILNIGPGDEVIVPSRTFMASASCVVLQGATPIFADVDPESGCIAPESIQEKITAKTKAIIPVHLAGWPCEMDKIMQIAKKHNLKVIEDCAQSHGASYQNKKLGSWGDMAAFSFCQDKIMTTGGEGGLLVLKDKNLWEQAWAFKDHGKDFDVVFNKTHPAGFRWLHESFGTNWRMTEMQAAIGRIQLKKLDEWVTRRNYLANLLDGFFRTLPGIRVPHIPNNIYHARYKYYVYADPLIFNRDDLMAKFNQAGVPCFSGSCSEIYLEQCFIKNNLGPETRLPVAKLLGEQSLCLLIHPSQTDQEFEDLINKLMGVMQFMAPRSASRELSRADT